MPSPLFADCSVYKRQIAVGTPARCDYIQNFGAVQWLKGYTDSFGITRFGPGVVPVPGQAPDFNPCPGGAMDWGGPPKFMDQPDLGSGKKYRDAIHLNPEGYKCLFANCLVNYYVNWLTDTTAPTCTSITRASGSPTAANTVVYYVGFSEKVQRVAALDFSLTGTAAAGASIADVSGSGTSYTVSITVANEGNIGLNIASGATIFDSAWNPLSNAPAGPLYTIDRVSPTAVISSTATCPTSIAPIPLTITFSEPVTGFTVGDLTLTNGVATTFSGSGSVYAFDVIPLDNDSVQVLAAGGTCSDQAGNPNQAAAPYFCTFNATGNNDLYLSDGSQGALLPTGDFRINTDDGTITGGGVSVSNPSVVNGIVKFNFTDVNVPAVNVTVLGVRPLAITATRDMYWAAPWLCRPGRWVVARAVRAVRVAGGARAAAVAPLGPAAAVEARE